MSIRHYSTSQNNISDRRNGLPAFLHRRLDEYIQANLAENISLDELMSPDIIYHFNSSSKLIIGLEANKEFNVSLFQGFPDIKQTIEDLVSEGDKVVYRTSLQGTHTGDFLGISPTNKSVKINDFTMLRIANNQIAEWWYETNLLEVMQQLGLA